MRRIRINLIRLIASIALLLIYSWIKFLILPEFKDYEFFSYMFIGGVLVYLISYVGTAILELIFKKLSEKNLSYIVFFLLLEGALFYFSGSCLVLSLIEMKNILVCVVYHLIPLIVYALSTFAYRLK